MNRILAAATGIALSTALLSAWAPALAQSAAPAAKASATAAKKPARAARHVKLRPGTTWADARVCLEFPTNAQIIKCSEKYRYMRVPA